MFRQSLAVTLLIALLTACGNGSDQAEFDPPPIADEKAISIFARTGPLVSVTVGATAVLSDNNSYSTGDLPLAYRWSFVSRPQGSAAVLRNPASTNPSFLADRVGDYRVQLIVSAAGVDSNRAIQLVIASSPGDLYPTGPFQHAGLSSDCGNCHNDLFVDLPAKPGRHMAASNACVACHSPLGWTLTPWVDHAEVFGACSECHDNAIAIGKSAFHVETTQECDDCHHQAGISFFELVDGRFDHSGIDSGCVGCHNGITALGKTPAPPHPNTGSDCVLCHTTESFAGADARPDHGSAAVTSVRCDSCHGVDASGPSADHATVGVDCGICHGIDRFDLGDRFDHSVIDPVSQPCADCHSGDRFVALDVPGPTPVPPHPVITSDCSNCHNTTDFADFSNFDHSSLAPGQRCDSCHGVDASGLSSDHFPIGVTDCAACHIPGTFASGVYDHAGVTTNCTDCHNATYNAAEKPFYHLPTAQGCELCHDTAAYAPTIFAHTGISVDCETCHNGDYRAEGALYKHANHVPSNEVCADCHASTTSFAGATFSHGGIVDRCDDCHASGIATPQTADHIPAIGDCVVCHTDTTDFLNDSFLGGVHSGYTIGCEGCHNGLFPVTLPNLVKDLDHLPTSQDCSVCHSVAGGFAVSTFAHVGIADNCQSCHDGSFAATGALGKTPSPPHPDTLVDCGNCHNTATFTVEFIDHSSPAVTSVRCDSCHGISATGMDPGHVPINGEDCAVCHVPGAFKPSTFAHRGIVDDCASCHVDGSADMTGKDDALPAHLSTALDCHFCHNTVEFAGAHFDHRGITRDCAACHDGSTAIGKHNSHVPTGEDCFVCHQTTGFVPATFDHTPAQINGRRCDSCHNDVFAPGKAVDHVPTAGDCGVCHNPQGFVPATFDHTGITSGCSGCHVDGSANNTGKDDALPPHLQTALDCYLCHTTATFAGGNWFHDASTVGQCDTCHSPGGGATSMPGGHLPTTYQCDVCHVTSGWAPTTFSHDPNGDYPGDHRRNPSCTTCHGPSIDPPFPWDFPQYEPFCAACHANDFRREGDHIGGSNGTVAQNQNCGQSGCHSVRNNGW